ncbi:transposase [Alloiococcus sp. CFN-8]|uniref:transposase n=1 Tax=Alloiococcus sp. CFN-8 TaxID=3416081 RepID=UPI003CED12C1
MTRKPRLEFQGAIYHVFQRGNNREHIFRDPVEKGYFLKQIKEHMTIYNYELFAYVIMDNHYHMILRTNEAALSKVMHRINNTYSKFYNYRRERTGHVFEERYNSKVVDDDAYLIWLLRYIHRNPVRANLCDAVSKYRWSSDFFYRRGIKSFVNIDLMLKILSIRRYEARKRYLQLMESLEEIHNTDFKDIKDMFPDIRFRNITVENSKSIESDRKALDEIISSIVLKEGDYDLIKAGSRKRHLMSLKLLYINEALKYKYTLKEIGEFIGISQSAVTKLIKKM